VRSADLDFVSGISWNGFENRISGYRWYQWAQKISG